MVGLERFGSGEGEVNFVDKAMNVTLVPRVPMSNKYSTVWWKKDDVPRIINSQVCIWSMP